MKHLSSRFYKGIVLNITDITELGVEEQKDYLSRASDLASDPVLENEIKKIIQASSQKIIRTCSNDVEVAWQRGVIYGMEEFVKNLQGMKHKHKVLVEKEDKAKKKKK